MRVKGRPVRLSFAFDNLLALPPHIIIQSPWTEDTNDEIYVSPSPLVQFWTAMLCILQTAFIVKTKIRIRCRQRYQSVLLRSLNRFQRRRNFRENFHFRYHPPALLTSYVCMRASCFVLARKHACNHCNAISVWFSSQILFFSLFVSPYLWHIISFVDS